MPFQTTYGISHRRFQPQQDHEESKAVPNHLALFGRPVESRDIEIQCINLKSSYGPARAGIAPSGNHDDWVIWATM